jgi:hypothetical protein
MDKNDIIIAEVNVNNLYNELIEKRKKIREGASKIMSDNLELAKSLTKTLVTSKDVEEIKKLANEAYEALEIVNMVSYASGIEYYLPYSSNYDDSSEIMSHVLDDCYYEEEYNKLLKDVPEIKKLTNLFYDLERQSGQWNTSFC